MKNGICLLLSLKCLLMPLSLLVAGNRAMAQHQNIAFKDDRVRFTLVSDGIVRMEYSPSGKFVDDISFVAVNRLYPKVNFKVSKAGGILTISTSKITLTYKLGSGSFCKDNLNIHSTQECGGVVFEWQPGKKDTANLMGTYRTLDKYNGKYKEGVEMPMEEGLLSRSGWTFIDDSNSYLFDHSDFPWVKNRQKESDTQDWYFMAYGHDYKKALRDFTLLSGKMPMPPRYAFGYWWSRYWSYTDEEFRSLVDHFHRYDIPLDVMVIDMDWHYTSKGKGGWTGYTWNRSLLPSPEKLINWMHSNNLKVTLNLHPADGIQPYEQQYPMMATWMGMNPTDERPIEWQSSSKRFMTGWLNCVLHPMEDMGVDFWWLDWQQKLNDNTFKRLSNTWWINYVAFSDMERHRATRPLIFHRWGGLGNHRYPIGFSGDAVISWESLAFQPYFNSTASNVLYGYWSHDIGGHMRARDKSAELYIRWLQFGVLSPILRTHSAKTGAIRKEPWTFDEKEFEILRNAILLRYKLAPYIYTMARKAYDDGVSICRPMYYDYPENEEAYQHPNEYMFGDNILVCPITSRMNDGFSKVVVWLPEGCDWYETDTGELLKGGQLIERSFRLSEYPVYIKAGSIMPTYIHARSLQRQDEPVAIAVYPGGDDGEFTWYEDNGDDQKYEWQFTTTRLTCRRKGRRLNLHIRKREGAYQQMPESRQMKVEVNASAVPEKVLVDGIERQWHYDGANLLLSIDLGQCLCSQGKDITIIYPSERQSIADGFTGKMKRMASYLSELKEREPELTLSERLDSMATVGSRISYNPETLEEEKGVFHSYYPHMAEYVAEAEQQLEAANQAYYSNPVIADYAFHDASMLRADDGYAYSFASSVMPRDTSKHLFSYTPVIFRSQDMVKWEFYKYAFGKNDITDTLITDYDRLTRRDGKYPYRTVNSVKYYPVWAPDVIKFKGKYLMFVSLHISAADSKIALFTSDSLNHDFKFVRTIISTDEGDKEAYVSSRELIDPFPIVDDGKLYLVYGSFSRDQNGRQIKGRKGIGVFIVSLNDEFIIESQPTFLTDYYEGVSIIRHNDRYFLVGTNGAWTDSTYQISYATSNRILGPYGGANGLPINSKDNYNPGTILLPLAGVTSPRNGLGCMTKPVEDDKGQQWVMVFGHDRQLQPIQTKRAERERYAFLMKLIWNSDGNPYLEPNDIIRNKILKPKFHEK